MGKVVTLSKVERLIGTWKSCDGFSSVEVTIGLKDRDVTVSVIDSEDAEVAEVQNVVWEERTSTLSFATHWVSSGRLTKYRVAPSHIPGRADVTFTYSAQDLWEQVVNP